MGRKHSPVDDLFGPVIHSYTTRAQAIADGVLVDVNTVAPEACRMFKYPIAMTAGAFAIVRAAVENEAFANSYEGVVHDILWMTIAAGNEIDESTRTVEVIIQGAGMNTMKRFKVMCGPGDDAEPVITVMLPDED